MARWRRRCRRRRARPSAAASPAGTPGRGRWSRGGRARARASPAPASRRARGRNVTCHWSVGPPCTQHSRRAAGSSARYSRAWTTAPSRGGTSTSSGSTRSRSSQPLSGPTATTSRVHVVGVVDDDLRSACAPRCAARRADRRPTTADRARRGPPRATAPLATSTTHSRPKPRSLRVNATRRPSGDDGVRALPLPPRRAGVLERLVDQRRVAGPHVEPAAVVAHRRRRAVGQPARLLHASRRPLLGDRSGRADRRRRAATRSHGMSGTFHAFHATRRAVGRRRRVEAEVGAAVVEAAPRGDRRRAARTTPRTRRPCTRRVAVRRHRGRERRPCRIEVGQPAHRAGRHRLQPQVAVGAGVDDGVARRASSTSSRRRDHARARRRMRGELAHRRAVERLPHQRRRARRRPARRRRPSRPATAAAR